MKKIFFLLLMAFVLPVTHGQVNKYRISPASANPFVKSFTAENMAMFSHDVPERKKLVVVLATTGMVPEDLQRFDSFAAKTGFHVIGLSYNNSPSAKDVCKNSNDPDCYENIRKQVIMGEVTSTAIPMDSNHHIVQRLKDMLLYLDTSATEDNWGQYLDGNKDIIWKKVMVAGHADGGTYAALMGKIYPLDRVLCFAPIPDRYQTNGDLAPWVTKDGMTKESNSYVFYQEEDTQTIDTNFYKGIGFSKYGKITYVEDIEYPFNYSRRLTTRFISDYNHTITVMDEHTPIEPNNEPKFKLVWGYMLTNDLFQSIEEKTNLVGRVYPNPAHNNLRIESNSNQKIEWTVIDVLGTKVMEGAGVELDVSQLNPGFFYLQLKEGNRFQTIKFVKQ